jgi:hypothetical protein
MPDVRRRRQRDELSALCAAGAVARAIDLAFEHFAEFGRDDAVVGLIAASVEQRAVSPSVRRQFQELRARAVGPAGP